MRMREPSPVGLIWKHHGNGDVWLTYGEVIDGQGGDASRVSGQLSDVA